MNRTEAFKLISESKAIIVPSKWYEGFPMTIVESFALGVPVIGSDLGNISEIIDNKYNGLLFNKDDKQSVKNCIEKLFYNNRLNIEMGHNAYKTFSKYYTDEENYKTLQNIYEHLVGDNCGK